MVGSVWGTDRRRIGDGGPGPLGLALLGHQASNYLTPVVALALLALLTEVSVARLDLLLVGAGRTIGVNALIRPKGTPAPEVVGSPLPTARRWIGGAPNLARFIGSCE